MKLDLINNYRTITMGIAALLIVIFHMEMLDFNLVIDNKIVAGTFSFIQNVGNIGVDIFLFLSGIGLYFSMSKNSIWTFYKNRMLRILPVLIIVVVSYYFIMGIFDFRRIMEAIFFVEFYVNGIWDTWYIQFIMGLYIIFPLIYKYIKKYDVIGLFISLICIMIFNMLILYLFPEMYVKYDLALTRIPVFLIGTLFGKKIYEGTKISLKMIYGSLILNVILWGIIYLIIDSVGRRGVGVRYIYSIIAMLSVINLTWLYSFIKWDILFKPFKFLGEHSLEIYLIYEKLCNILVYVFKMSNYLVVYLLGFVITMMLVYILRKIVDLIFRIITGKFMKKELVGSG